MSGDAEMQTRKLQKVGGSTYTVSIPKRWAGEHDLAAGDDVHLYAHDDGSVVVRSAERDGGALSSVRVEVDEQNENATTAPSTTAATVERTVKAAYAAGFEDIELASTVGFDAEHHRAANALAKTLIGTEVVAADDDRITVRNLLDSGNVSIRQSLDQLRFVTLSMHRSATAVAPSADPGSRVADREAEVGRLVAMITRHFNRSLTDFSEVDRLDVGRTALFGYYVTARQLDRVANHAVELARITGALDGEFDGTPSRESGEGPDGKPDESLGGETTDEFEAIADSARQVVEDATDAVLADADASTPSPTAILDRRDEVVADAEALERSLFKSDDPDAYRLTRALDRVVRTTECGGTVAEVAVQSALRSQE